jgi:hypothetical protein
MAENTNLGLTVEAWADIVIERWERKIDLLKIGRTGNLAKSFAQHVNTQANGDVDLVTFTFEYYGKYVDMGVGRGMTAGSRNDLGESFYSKRNDLGQLHTHSRVKKPWYSKVFFSELIKLREILAQKYAYKAQMAIITEVEQLNIDDPIHQGANSVRKKSNKSGNPTARQYDRMHGN